MAGPSLYLLNMSKIYDWTDPDAKTIPLRDLSDGSIVVVHKSIPGKNDEYHILEIIADAEHEFDFIGSMQKPEMALLVADMIFNYFQKIRDPHNIEMPGVTDMILKKRKIIDQASEPDNDIPKEDKIMSNILRWEPLTENNRELSYDLRNILRRFFERDTVDDVLSESDIPVLYGMKAGLTDSILSKEVDNLIEIVRQHKQIKLYESN